MIDEVHFRLNGLVNISYSVLFTIRKDIDSVVLKIIKQYTYWYN